MASVLTIDSTVDNARCPAPEQQLAESPDELVSLLRENNVIAFEKLYKMFWKKLCRLGFRFSNDKELSRDIAQEIFIDIWNRRETIQINNVTAFLLKAVKQQAIKIFRQQPPPQEGINENRQFLCYWHIEESLCFKETHYTVEKSISRLPDQIGRAHV